MMDQRKWNSSQFFWTAFFLIVYAILMSVPILSAGYYNDDVPNGLTLGVTQLIHQSVFEISKSNFLGWFSHGRIFPIAIFTGYPFFYFFHTIESYQIARVCCIWLSLLSVAWLVKLISRQIEAAILVLFLIPLFWSIRNYFDPLTSFGVLLPCVVLLSTLTLCFFIKALTVNEVPDDNETASSYIKKRGGTVWFVFRAQLASTKNKPYCDRTPVLLWYSLSIITYLLALCTYEIAIVTFVIIMWMSWKSRISFRIVSPYIIILLCYLLLTYWLRSKAVGDVYDGIQIGSISGFFNAFLDQLIAGLPLSYGLFAADRYFTQPLVNPYFSVWIQILPAFVLFSISLLPVYSLLSRMSLNKKSNQSFCFIGAAFVFIPALLVGLSKKYQTSIHLGIGYLPVYMEYVGFALILLAILSCIGNIESTNRKKRICWMVSCLLCLVISNSYFLNYYVVRLVNGNWQNPRTLVEHAIQENLFSEVPDSATIYIRHSVEWNSPEFYMQNTGKHFRIVDLKNQNQIIVKSGESAFLLDYYCFRDSIYGYVLLSRIKAGEYQAVSQQTRLLITNPKIYILSGIRKFIFFNGQYVSFNDVADQFNRDIREKLKIVNKNQKSQVMEITAEYWF